MGWAILVGLAGLAIGVVLCWARPPRAVAQLLIAAMLLAFAGYAWQGKPGLAGKPTPPHADRGGIVTSFASERGRFLERFGPDATLLDSADALIRNGAGSYAVGILRGGVERKPGSPDLWLGLANALIVHADGAVTPAALYCFERADALAPGSPAPRYFAGLTYAEEGDFDRAEQTWRALLSSAPQSAPWRIAVEQKLVTLTQIRRMAEALRR